MSLSKNTINTLIASAFVVTLAGGIGSANAKMGADKEKCYGVVKAGKNTCASSDGKHSCMGQATEDGAATDWIAVPKGLCDKLVGGKKAEAGGDMKMDHKDMKMDHEG